MSGAAILAFLSQDHTLLDNHYQDQMCSPLVSDCALRSGDLLY